MKKIVLMAVVALCVAGCCKKAAEQEGCTQECTQTYEQKCCDSVAVETVVDSAAVETPVVEAAE